MRNFKNILLFGITMRFIQKVIVEEKSGKTFFVKDLEEDFHTEFGVISHQDLSSKKETIFSSKGHRFSVFAPAFIDLWHSLERGPQALRQKDIGLILAKTGVNNKFKVVDAGGGSGALCLALANVCKEITVYEMNPQHSDILERNITAFGLKNIFLKKKNIYQSLEEKELDLITLDLPEPWKVVSSAEEALKTGGFLVVYVPNLTQVQLFLDAVKKTKFKVLETVELLERSWKIEAQIMRPEFEMLGHTGFLTFCRKL